MEKLKCSDGFLYEEEVKQVNFILKGIKEGWGELSYYAKYFKWTEVKLITPIKAKIFNSNDLENCQIVKHKEERHWFQLKDRTRKYLLENYLIPTL